MAGNNKAISTSKIKKITAIRKNRKEKGSRDEDLGSNPHSNGDAFSRSIILFFDRREARIITAVTIKNANIIKVNKTRIIYSKFLDLLVGSQIYFLY